MCRLKEGRGFPLPLSKHEVPDSYLDRFTSHRNDQSSLFFLGAPELNTHPTYSPVYASPGILQCPVQNSGPGGSLAIASPFS